jgi:hypothetical protein
MHLHELLMFLFLIHGIVFELYELCMYLFRYRYILVS